MGVCCGRNINNHIYEFITKANENKVNYGNEDKFKSAVIIAQEYKKDNHNMGDMTEILLNDFKYFENSSAFGSSYIYSFIAKDHKGDTYICNVTISHSNPNKYECEIIKQFNGTEMVAKRDKSPKTVISIRSVSFSKKSNINNSNNNNNSISKSNNNPISDDKSTEAISYKSVITSQKRNTSYPNSHKSSPLNKFKHTFGTVKKYTVTSNIKPKNTEEITPRKSNSDNKVTSDNNIDPITKFRINASKAKLNYGKEFYFTKALQLVEKQGKHISEIELNNFFYSDCAMTSYGKSYRYQFIIKDIENIRYNCDISIAINGRDNVVKISPYVGQIRNNSILTASLSP